MGRMAKERTTGQPKPVEKIELSEKHIGWRIFFFILFVVIAATAFAYGINSLFTTEPGWQEIEADAAAGVNCGNEFVLMYHLGISGRDATVENKALKIIYTDACELAYKLFHNKETFDDVTNICYINQHPNEEIVVDDALYQAFSIIQRNGDRRLYLGPVYDQYEEIFYCEDDTMLVNYDPLLNEELAAEYAMIADYANNPQMIDIKLLDDNKIMLEVSKEYLAFAEEHYITQYIDFFWMKNAFVTDYLADTLIENGYTAGTISSYDGFSRNLGKMEESFSFNIYDRMGQTIYPAAVMQYSGTRSIVYLRDYMMNNQDEEHYYVMEDGTIRTSYIDVNDGIAKTATDNLYAYSEQLGCAELLLKAAPVYVTDDFSEEAVKELTASGVYIIYCEDNTIKYNDASLVLTDFFDESGITYKKAYVGK